jgi:hypothetical protein
MRQFEAILFAMDETGFITSFLISRTKSLKECEAALKEVSRRSPNLRFILTGMNYNASIIEYCAIICVAFISDNCCADRAILEEIFGKSIKVRLDPFHAIQRCTKVIKKKDMAFACRRDFAIQVSKVLRSSEDRDGKKRQLQTADPAEISQNISSLLSDDKKLFLYQRLESSKNFNRNTLNRGV